MLRAVVVDDEVLIAEHTCRLLKDIGVEVLGCYSNPLVALEMIEVLQPDVLFLDIEMPEMSGIEIAEKVYSRNYTTEIVFITAYNQYAVEAFRVNALDYLLKPVIIEDLEQAVERVKKRLNRFTNPTVNKHKRSLHVFLFGSISVYVDNETKPIRWVTAKCAELFAYMMLQRKDGEISKWKLIDVLWQEKNIEKADINLRSTVSRLNKTLREYNAGISLVNTRNCYQLEISDVLLHVDAFQLERFVLDSVEIRKENQEQVEEVLYRCEHLLLEELSSEWSQAYRDQYLQYFIHLANRMLQYYERIEEEPFKAMKLVELLITYDHYEDDFRLIAIKLIERITGKKQAIEYYHHYVSLLALEIGIEPSDTLKAKYQSLLELL